MTYDAGVGHAAKNDIHVCANVVRDCKLAISEPPRFLARSRAPMTDYPISQIYDCLEIVQLPSGSFCCNRGCTRTEKWSAHRQMPHGDTPLRSHTAVLATSPAVHNSPEIPIVRSLSMPTFHSRRNSDALSSGVQAFTLPFHSVEHARRTILFLRVEHVAVPATRISCCTAVLHEKNQCYQNDSLGTVRVPSILGTGTIPEPAWNYSADAAGKPDRNFWLC